MIAAVIIGVFIADQLTKYLALAALSPRHPFPIIPGIFDLTLVRNTGGAFGLLQQHPRVFTVLSIMAIVWIASWLYRMRRQSSVPRPTYIALAAILGGAFGNLTDRLRWGYVVDFLDFQVWPVFNIADSAITIGVGALLWYSWRSRRPTTDEMKK